MHKRLKALEAANRVGDAIKIDILNHVDKKGVKWANIDYDDGVTCSRCTFKFGGLTANGTAEHEKTMGRVAPNSDAAVAEINAAIADPKRHVDKRPGAPTAKFPKWRVPVKTGPDGYSPVTDEFGAPILPGDEHLSDLYSVIAIIGRYFETVVAALIARGNAIMEAALTSAVDARGVQKYSRREGAVVAALVAAHPPKGALLSPEQMALLRKPTSGYSKAEVDQLTAGAIVNNLKIVMPMREFFGATNPNAGQPRPNPVTDITIKHDENGIFLRKIYDMKKESALGGKISIEEAKWDGDPLNADNIHEWLISGTDCDGIVNMSGMCFSQVGISMPREMLLLFGARPEAVAHNDLELLYGAAAAGGDAPAAARGDVDASGDADAAASGGNDDLLDELDV
jgi:hypothetical protein